MLYQLSYARNHKSRIVNRLRDLGFYSEIEFFAEYFTVVSEF